MSDNQTSFAQEYDVATAIRVSTSSPFTYQDTGNSVGVLDPVGSSAGSSGSSGQTIGPVSPSGNLSEGMTGYNSGTGWWLGIDKGIAKFSFGDGGVSSYITWDGSTLSVVSNNIPQLTKGYFGGNGSDGALSITSGTTTVSLGSASVVTKNYTSIAITGTGVLAFSSPHANGTTLFLRSQGAVTITSATVPCIDLRGNGAQGVSQTSGVNPNTRVLTTTNNFGVGGTGSSSGTAGGGAYDMPNFYTTSTDILGRRYVALICGASGGGSASNGQAGGNSGGSGGGAMLIECGGALNFTGTIDSSGSNGPNGGDGTGSVRGEGGAGGGSAGTVVLLYNTLTANSGTITASGGNGGTAGTSAGTAGVQEGGAGGAGSLRAAGGAGGNGGSVGNGGTGLGAGAGGGGVKSTAGAGSAGGTGGGSMGGLVALNTYFA